MPDFLLEIGCEEIPARMLDDGMHELLKRMFDLLGTKIPMHHTETGPSAMVGERQASILVQSFSTPRRLGLLVKDLPLAQPDVTEQVMGPSGKIAFKDGKPTPAADAFAKKAGVDVTKLERVTNPKGEYLAATVTRKGRRTAEVLAEILPKEIAGIYWPKNMYWRAAKPERFVRPVRWIVALLDGEAIPLEFGGIQAGNRSRGHRILGPEEVSIESPAHYADVMDRAHVVIGGAGREGRIRKSLDAATRTVPGARWRD